MFVWSTHVHASYFSALSAQPVQFSAANHSVSISWREAGTAPLPAAYVVEWYPEGLKMDEFRWMRLDGSDNHAVITGGTASK